VWLRCARCHGALTDEVTLGLHLGAPEAWTHSLHVLRGVTIPCPACKSERAYALSFESAGPTAIVRCEHCASVWLEGGALARLRGGAVRAASSPHKDLVESAPAIAMDGGDRFSFDSPWVNRLALPLAFVLGLWLSSGSLQFLVRLLVTSWAHELGHALAAWLTGCPAIPAFLVTVRFERSVWFAATLSIVLGIGSALALWSFVAGRKRADANDAFVSLALPYAYSTFLRVIIALAWILQVYGSWFASVWTAEHWCIFGGCAG